jgi:hypothetical protein
MEQKTFPWTWLIVSLLLLVGTPVIHLFIVLPNAEPDGLAAVGGFCFGIMLMPIGLLSLLTLGVWVSRQRRLQEDFSLQLNLAEKTRKLDS